MRVWLAVAMAAIGVAVGACSTPERLPAVPRADTERAQPLGIAKARFYPDSDPQAMALDATEALQREIAALPPGAKVPPANFLAVSGGGDNGAFGAGLLNGWTETGTRPQFKGVTGVSTGALIAPLAFLGPPYDPVLREVYTTINAERVYRFRGLTAAVFDDAMADTTPLSTLIARYFDQKMLDDIAAEYRKGRLLLIGTTDLDAQRPVIWNIGAIADSGKPGALALVHQILRASAAIPGAFQPVLIDVELDGKKYQELHVDGGAIAQLFLYPPSLDLGRTGIKRERHAWIIRNARLDPDWANSERRTISIAGRAISTMLAASGRNDVLRVYFVAQRDHVDYNLAYIGHDFDGPEKKGEFDQAYMRALYDYGYRQARAGLEWHKAPPGLGRE
ncbi:MAG: patatin-like phospholipase family protein [Proteobacteria bacterium]|nr:patatin-like phospholipase family protein [Pseudomonadota bacterium]